MAPERYPRDLLRAIIAASERYNVPADLLVATTLVESGGRLDAVGDGGRSHGPFQEFDEGRGKGLSVAERRNPWGAAERAAREFAQYRRSNYGDWAAAAQRPADREGYSRKIMDAMEPAREILREAGEAAPNFKDELDEAAEKNPNILERAKNAVVGQVTGWITDWALKIFAVIALFAIAVFLITQGASKAFGTPAPGELAGRLRP